MITVTARVIGVHKLLMDEKYYASYLNLVQPRQRDITHVLAALIMVSIPFTCNSITIICSTYMPRLDMTFCMHTVSMYLACVQADGACACVVATCVKMLKATLGSPFHLAYDACCSCHHIVHSLYGAILLPRAFLRLAHCLTSLQPTPAIEAQMMRVSACLVPTLDFAHVVHQWMHILFIHLHILFIHLLCIWAVW